MLVDDPDTVVSQEMPRVMPTDDDAIFFKPEERKELSRVSVKSLYLVKEKYHTRQRNFGP